MIPIDKNSPNPHKELQKELHHRLLQQQFLSDLGQMALSGASLTELYDVCVCQLAKQLRMDYTAIFKFQPEERLFLLHSGVGWIQGLTGSVTLQMAEVLQTGINLFTDSPLILDDENLPDALRDRLVFHAHGIATSILMPLHYKEHLFGLISVHTTQPYSLTQDEIQFLQSVTRILSLAIHGKKHVQDLHERYTQSHQMLDQAPMLIGMMDGHGEYQYLNQTWRDFTGCSFAQLQGKGWLSRLHPADILTWQQKFETAAKGGLPFRIECRFRRKDDGYCWLLCQGTPRRAADHQFEGYICVSIDIDAYKQVETMFQQTQERAETTKELYRLLYMWEKRTTEAIQHIRQPLDISNIFSTVVEELGTALNLDWCFIVQFQDLQVVPVQYEYRKSAELPSVRGIINDWKACPLVRQGMAGEPAYVTDIEKTSYWLEKEVRLLCQAHGVRGMGAIPIRYENEILCLLVLYTREPHQWEDQEIFFVETIAEQLAITLYQLKVKEELEKTAQLKTSILANVSHELRTPLNAIIGYSEMLLQGYSGELNEKQQRYINNVAISGHHLLTMVNDLLDLSKIEAGKITLTLEWLKPESLVNDLMAVFNPLAASKNVLLTFTIEPGLEGLKADGSRLRQIFLNLISNAIKFNREGGEVTIRIGTSEDGQWVVCDVMDTGIGIPADKIPSLFTEFYQVDHGYSRAQEGTGLGLSLVKRLVELHGGTIQVTSHEGMGSTFSFRLPV